MKTPEEKRAAHREYMQRYRQDPKNAEKHRNWSKAWSERNPEKTAAYKRDYKAKNRTPKKPYVMSPDASYSVVHRRLRLERGRAADHVCACGKTARHWAFDEPTGYSTDLSRYTPMCVSCHRKHDYNARLALERREAA